jgi:acyl-CoA thioester hydrolase
MAHFAAFFRYMEEAEHAWWRAAGMTIHDPDAELKWPRVSAAFDFKRPLRFEDEFEVQVSIAAVTARTIQYDHTVVRGSDAIGTGSITAACVRREADGTMKAVEIPADVIARLRAQV